jgi:DNA-binding response OmpR family regulator
MATMLAADAPFVLEVGGLCLDLIRQEAYVEGRRVHLTLSELKLLTLLAAQPGVPVPRAELMRRLWASDHVGDGHACEVHISNLRRKLESDPLRPRRLVTVRGVGYKLVPI